MSVEDEQPIDGRKFLSRFTKLLEEQLEARIKEEHRKRPALMTDIVLESLAVAATGAANAGSWPSNQPVMIQISAHKSTERVREMIAENPDLAGVQVSPCLGSQLDMQVRQGNQVLLNAESELAGSRQQAEDMAKLTAHTQSPLASAMVVRAKSLKELERTRRRMGAEAKKRSEPFTIAALHWPNNKPIRDTDVHIDIVNKPEES